MAEMQPTTAILARIKRDSSQNGEEVFTRLYRYLLRPDIWHLAYKHLYANDGAATKGVDNDTADGFSEAKVNKIIKALQDETYQPKPVRRTYIAKENNPQRLRPLGIPTFTDKLVQEVLKMILEAVYEPVFLDCSHGFRPDKSCHTALKSISRHFVGAKWFVEGDIKGCFDNIDHKTLISFINQKVKDARIIKLIYKFLKAGYLENWQYHKTYSGTPQGGIISPLLANIYLHELDKFVMRLKADFDKPNERVRTTEYNRLFNQRQKLKKLIDEAEGTERQDLLKEYKLVRAAMLKTPYTPQENKSIKYVRYADDFLIAVKGSREDCVEIKRKLAEYIGQTLKMELSEGKTLITHSNEYARFLGYDIRVRRESAIKPNGKGNPTQRSMNYTVELNVPLKDKINKFLFSKGIVKQKTDGSLFPIHRRNLVNMTDLEIVTVFNAELRGICNYYALASNFYHLHYFNYLMEYSCLKTLCSKHKCSIGKIRDKFKDGKGSWAIPYDTKKGRNLMYFAKYADCKKADRYTDNITNAAVMHGSAINTFERRLAAKVCELCGSTEAENYDIHHVHKVKDLKGKTLWERAMIAKRRKTMVVCEACHKLIHSQ